MSGVRLSESVGSAGGVTADSKPPASATKRMGSLLGAPLRLAWFLGRDGWPFLVALSFGLLAAIVLLSVVPLYDALITNLQLQSAINRGGVVSRNLDIQFTTTPVTGSFISTQDAYVRPLAGQYLGSFTLSNPIRSLTSSRFPLVSETGTNQNAFAATTELATLAAYNYTQASSHIHLVAGALPQARLLSMPSAIDALIPNQMAQSLGLSVGDKITLREPAGSPSTIALRVAGIWQPQSDDAFWNGRAFYFVVPGVSKDSANTTILIDPVDLLTALENLNGVSVAQDWVYVTVPARISTSNLSSIQNDIAALRSRIGQTRPIGPGNLQIAVITSLDASLASVATQLKLLTFPLTVIAALIVGLALLFVALMASLQAEGQSAAIATLKSRGASNGQVYVAYLLLALILALVTLAAGPWLARLLSVRLVIALVPAITLAAAGVSEAALWPLVGLSSTIVPAALAAVLGAAAMLIAVGQAARLQVVTLRRRGGRAEGAPLWQRLYLDVWLAVLCVLGYVDLNLFGGLGSRASLGAQAASPLVLATPALLLLAGELLVLRVLPPLANLGLTVTSRRRGAVGMLAFAQVSRHPSSAARIVVLLSLAIAVGLFAVVFDGSVAHNVADRANYQAGADYRVILASSVSGAVEANSAARIASWPGVLRKTPVFRGAFQTSSNTVARSVVALAVDARTWEAGANTWRSDYADEPIATLMAQMKAHVWRLSTADAPAEPGDGGHPIWMIVSQNFAASQHVSVGSRVSLAIADAAQQSTLFVVGAIVHDFPTMYDTQAPGGFVIMDMSDYTAMRASPTHGPDEYWLHTTSIANLRTALNQRIAQDAPALSIINVQDRRAIADQIGRAPIQAGVRGLLLLGAVIAGALVLLACIIQAALAARLRTLQFAVQRSLGISRGQLTAQLLIEQLFMYGLSLVAGSALGVLLTFAALPFLQFSDTPLDPTTIGIPPYVVTWQPAAVALVYATLLVALAAALLIAGTYASRVGFGRALRIGED